MMAEHDRMKLEDTILEGLLPKIVAKSKIDFEVNDGELKAICSLIVTLPRSKKKQVMTSKDVTSWVTNGLIHWIHVSKRIFS
jgi:hypothetical protein